MEEPQHDVEDQAVVSESDRREFREAALLLAMWSILVMNEGVIRFIQDGKPGADDLFKKLPNLPIRFWGPFLGGLLECIFGLFGLAVGLAAGITGYYSRGLTFALVGVQNLLGWYVFIDYVFVIPAFRIANGPRVLGMPEIASNAYGVMGILTSVAFCLALQGGQFVFICRLIAFSTPSDFLNQRTGAKMRAIFWNLNYALAGLWSIVGASIVINNVGDGITAPGPFFAPPNVGRIPVYLLITGMLMFVWPLLGIGICFTNNKPLVRKYAYCSFFVFLYVWVHYTIGQLGYIANNPVPSAIPAAGGATHNHLVMMVCFLGPYFMLKQAQESQK